MLEPDVKTITAGFNEILHNDISKMLFNNRNEKEAYKVSMTVIYEDLRTREFNLERNKTQTMNDVFSWAKNIIDNEALLLGVIFRYPSRTLVSIDENSEIAMDVVNFVSISKNRTVSERRAFQIMNKRVSDKYLQSFYDDDIEMLDSLINTQGNC